MLDYFISSQSRALKNLGASERRFKNHQPVNDEKCARKISHGQEKRSALNDDTVPRKKDNVPGDDFKQLVQELEFVERETGLHDALLFLEFDKYYNSWNKPLN